MRSTTFRPRKSLGQNFLVDENIARKIIQRLTPTPQDVILEIGPGFGVLTKYLIPEVKQVIAVEIDRNLSKSLRSQFSHHKNFRLIEGDFLKLTLNEFVRGRGRCRVLGNIPYHITSPVIFKIFKFYDLIFDMVLMIQKEVAHRIVAAPGSKEYGILSVFSQLFSEPRIFFHVSKNVFKPKPEVDSSVVRWDFLKRKKLNVKNAELLDALIHGVFQQRRKMLRKSLKSIPQFANKLHNLDFNLEKRPEDLNPEEFVILSNLMSE
ncbi:MAG: 16S rRNA (adenine(1518)-N(6)/adenine(1519)-N(6))-dimethyltransferase RsmA [bacterium]